MNVSKILISTPVSSRGWCLPYFLEHLYQLNFPKSQISFLFLVNNSIDNSQQILEDFKQQHIHEYNNIHIESFPSPRNMPQDVRIDEIRKKFSYQHLSNLRNKSFEYATRNGFDRIFSVDSDIMVLPETLNKLLTVNVDACAGVIWNGHKVAKSEPWKYPNILRKLENGKFEHISNYYIKNSPNLTESKIAEIGASGAVILLSRNIFTKTKYQWHEQGEDCGWAVDCANKGFKIHVDYSAFCHHMMDKEMLDEYISKQKI